ncbi:MAG: DUF2510 domain-containing protein, partial [Acidimicrobiales bacterium]
GSTEASESSRAAGSYPAGWYPDPSGSGSNRYWDGSSWTDSTSGSSGTFAGAAGAGVAGGASIAAVSTGSGRQMHRGKMYIVGSAVVVVVLIVVVAVVLFTGGNSNSPDGVATRAVHSVLGGNPAIMCQYVLPSQQSQCKAGISREASGGFRVSGNLAIGKTQVEGNRALVSFTGRMCVAVSGHRHCTAYSNPDAGLAGGHISFQQAFTRVVTGAGGSSAFVMPCMLQNGRWYIDNG